MPVGFSQKIPCAEGFARTIGSGTDTALKVKDAFNCDKDTAQSDYSIDVNRIENKERDN